MKSSLVFALLSHWSAFRFLDARILDSKHHHHPKAPKDVKGPSNKKQKSKKNKPGQSQPESLNYGYTSAERLWSSGNSNYNCDNVIQRYWADVKKKVGRFGWNPLFYAANQQIDEYCLKYLTKNGLDPKETDSNGRNALNIQASMQGLRNVTLEKSNSLKINS